MTTDAKKAEEVAQAPEKQAEATPNDSRTGTPGTNWEHIAKTHKGRLEAAQAELEKIKAAAAEKERQELEATQQYQKLYEDLKSEYETSKSSLAEAQETLKALQTAKAERETAEISSLLESIATTDQESAKQYIEGLPFAKQVQYLKEKAAMAGTPSKTPITQSKVNEGKQSGSSFMDTLLARKAEREKNK